MKMKLSILAIIVAVLGISAANAQWHYRGNYKKVKYNKTSSYKYRNNHDGYYVRAYHHHKPIYRSYTVSHRMPPGHAKKLYNYQSARNFTPGYNKRYYTYYTYRKAPRTIVYLPRY